MDDLVAFMRRCLDDDERAIERMRSTPMHGVESGAEEDYLMFANRAPAEVKAKRRVIDVLRGYEPNDEWETQPDMGLRQNNAAGALRALAQPYAGREGWREEWRSLTP